MSSVSHLTVWSLLLVILTVAVDAGTNCTGYVSKCSPGLVLPIWQPQENISLGDRIGRAIVYFVVMCYIFLGVSIIADRFMASIEVITSQEREVKVTRPNGEIFTVTVRVWNETVSNLTLMALGSSAPEILLSIIEVCGNNFVAGDLGPNTIVGSAAFNLFMIITICVFVVPSDQIRRQNHLTVFLVTATWSVLAYVWLYFILAVSSPDVVEVWEGLLTFLFFPITVVTAYIADRKLLVTKFITKKYRRQKKDGVYIATETGPDAEEMRLADGTGGYRAEELENPEVRAFEQHRAEFMEIFKELRRKNPSLDVAQLQQMAEYEMLNRGPKSRAFYRVQATRKLVGGGNVIKKKLEKEHTKSLEALTKAESLIGKFTTKISFDPGHYTVLENIGTFPVTIVREGGPEDQTILVDYRTEDGSANAGSDYIAASGTLVFQPGERSHSVNIEVVDDDVFEEDEHFYIHLENLRVKTRDGILLDPSKLGGMPLAELTTPFVATVMILDDDHAGVFSVEHAEYEVNENAGALQLRIVRSSGARGKVLIPYRTVDGSAIGDRDYERQEGEIVFDNDETEKFISIGIVDDEEYEKTEDFFVELSDPIWAKNLSGPATGFMSMFNKGKDKELDEKSVESAEKDDETEDEKIAELGRPRLGDVAKCRVRIKESMEFKSVVDKIMKTANASLVVGTSSWREQFIEAITVSAGDDDDEGGEEGEVAEGEEAEEKLEKLPTCGDYLMHFISVPWKILFALIPPTDYWGGWACFVASIIGIGLLTAVIGDVAAHFGCSIGLKDAVTAISFVALGTSVPDTFASKVAAIQDKYADSSIGNVTGSNAVNVFLGIGIAWSIAAIYHAIIGTPGGFHVPRGSLAFSVTIFCVEAVVCIGVILLRRIPAVGGELGGPTKFKIPTCLLLTLLWFTYLLLSSLESYCIIEGF